MTAPVSTGRRGWLLKAAQVVAVPTASSLVVDLHGLVDPLVSLRYAREERRALGVAAVHVGEGTDANQESER